MNEFSLIDTYFKALSERTGGMRCDLGIGDDCALLTVPPGKQLAVTADTLNAGVHFPLESDPFDIGFKALAVNLSDLAAMGAQPAWYTLCLSLPEQSDQWLQRFCAGLEALMQLQPITLAGGDTTRGPLSITVQAMGLVDAGQALRRNGAQIGDDIYVSGTIGDAGVGLKAILQNINVKLPALDQALVRLQRPLPRNALGLQLLGLASACIDVSDGLLADLGHILERSGVGADIDLMGVPVTSALRDADIVNAFGLSDRSLRELHYFAASAGDDYELCFTVSPAQRDQIAQIAQSVGIEVTRIGMIIPGKGIVDSCAGGETITPLGYTHF